MKKVIPKKRLGQHFLKDKSVINKILELITPLPLETILEVGPGMGALTQKLIKLDLDNAIEAVEIDKESVDFLQTHFTSPRLQIIHENILNYILSKEHYFLVGNLPYNISSAILFYVLENHNKCRKAVFMLQREVAERIVAESGSKAYGILSVLLGAYYERSIAFYVPSGAFFPPPKVESAIVVLTRKDKLPSIDFILFKNLVKRAFNQRRKTLRNALKSLAIPLSSELANKRAEELSITTYIQLCQNIMNSNKIC